eukprot:3305056-Prorocentrum_lima.AAC.1
MIQWPSLVKRERSQHHEGGEEGFAPCVNSIAGGMNGPASQRLKGLQIQTTAPMKGCAKT